MCTNNPGQKRKPRNITAAQLKCNIRMDEHHIQDDGIYDVEFVRLLQHHKDVLNKSQLPGSRQKKEIALKRFREDILRYFGKDLTEAKILKKVNNMKSRLKKKIDLALTSNMPVKLNEWQKLLCELLQGDSNSTLPKITEVVSLGIPSPNNEEIVIVPEVCYGDSTIDAPSICSQLPPPKRKKEVPPRTNDSLGELETDETRKLSTEQLQRLVLLEQLQVLRLKKKKLLIEIQDSESRHECT